MMRVSALLLVPLAVARPPLEVESYSSWLNEFASPYKGSEEGFNANIAKIRAHNANRTKTYTMGVNKFTALTSSEFKSIYRGYAKPSMAARNARNVVTPVKSQGQCGGCWAFSAVETLEFAVAIATGKLMELSQQQVIDCTPNPDQCGGTGGCNGATQELAFAFVANTSGITTNANYPWTGTSTFPTCNTTKIQPVATIESYVTLPFNDYNALMNAVVSVGPIAISAAAEQWFMYEDGVFYGDCGTDVDHAVVLVGYGHDNVSGLDYYLVRNSWGADWGENGYIRIARYGSTPSGEPCGTDSTPGDDDGCKGGPASITVCGECGILSDSSYPIGARLV